MPVTIKGLGGFDQIGASAAFVSTPSGKNLMIDCGLSVGSRRDGDQTVHFSETHAEPPGHVEAVLVTHAHNDHIGNLANMSYMFPEAKVFMTRPTFHIGGSEALNTSRLIKKGIANPPIGYIGEPAKYQHNFLAGFHRAFLGNQENVINAPGWVSVLPGVDAYFGPSGHIRGAAYIVLRIDEGNGKYKYIMFTGDVSFYDSPTVKGMRVPEEFVGKLDAIFVESTYGDRQLIPRYEEAARMVYWALKTIEDSGICLAPGFGISRCQNVLLDQVKGGVKPLFLDGRGRVILGIYEDPEKGYWCDLDHSDGVDLRNDPRILCISDREDREDLIYDSGPFSVVTTAGMMMTGSWANLYATSNGFLENPANTLLLTGFQAENTRGRILEDAVQNGRPIRLGGSQEIVIRANVPPRLQLSDHADGEQIARIVMDLRPRRVFVVHGHDNGRRGLENNLRKAGFGGPIHLPANGDEIEI